MVYDSRTQKPDAGWLSGARADGRDDRGGKTWLATGLRQYQRRVALGEQQKSCQTSH